MPGYGKGSSSNSVVTAPAAQTKPSPAAGGAAATTSTGNLTLADAIKKRDALLNLEKLYSEGKGKSGNPLTDNAAKAKMRSQLDQKWYELEIQAKADLGIGTDKVSAEVKKYEIDNKKHIGTYRFSETDWTPEEIKAWEVANAPQVLAKTNEEIEKEKIAQDAANSQKQLAEMRAKTRKINEERESLANSGPTPSGGELISKGWDGIRSFLKTILSGALGWAFGADNVNKCVDWCFDAVGNLVSGGADATKGMGKAGKAIVGVLGGLIASGPVGWALSKIPGMGWVKGNPLLTISSALGGAMLAGNFDAKEGVSASREEPLAKPEQPPTSVRGEPTDVASLSALHNACALVAPGSKIIKKGNEYVCTPAPTL